MKIHFRVLAFFTLTIPILAGQHSCAGHLLAYRFPNNPVALLEYCGTTQSPTSDRSRWMNRLKDGQICNSYSCVMEIYQLGPRVLEALHLIAHAQAVV